jgi:hypothetical protein
MFPNIFEKKYEQLVLIEQILRNRDVLEWKTF